MSTTHRNPDVVPMAELCERLECSDETIRKAIRQETADRVPDHLRFVPGGRHYNSSYRVYRGIFDKVLAGNAIHQPATKPMIPFLREVGV